MTANPITTEELAEWRQWPESPAFGGTTRTAVQRSKDRMARCLDEIDRLTARVAELEEAQRYAEERLWAEQRQWTQAEGEYRTTINGLETERNVTASTNSNLQSAVERLRRENKGLRDRLQGFLNRELEHDLRR